MQTSDVLQAGMIAHIKSQTSVVALLTAGGTGAQEVRECEWQSTDFKYPNIRVSVDLFPTINGCGPDKANFLIETFSEQKSSLEAETIASTMAKLFHKHPFSVTVTMPNQSPTTLKFPIVVVTEVMKAERSIYGWLSKVVLHTQVV